MRDVWHLFGSQVSALRWWLLAWGAALTAWTAARWTYLTTWRRSWMDHEHTYWYGLLIFSVLLAAVMIHLHPPGKRVAGWRVWPLRKWKAPAAQMLFVMTFLVLLPGAAEAVFLLHPKLKGFMAGGMLEWLTWSLWPLPVALGVAACSHSLRRFILDALILTAIVIGAWFLWNYSWRWLVEHHRWTERGFSVFHRFRQWLPAGALLVWALLCCRWLSQGMGRVVLYLTPVICCAIALTLRFTGRPDPDYVPMVTGDAELAGRVRLRLKPIPQWVSGEIPLFGRVSATAEIDGLRPNEYAWFSLYRTKFFCEGVTLADNFVGGENSSGMFGDTGWTQWSGSSGDAEKQERVKVRVLTAPVESLRPLHQKTCRLETTAVVSVQKSLGLARQSFQQGAKWDEAGRELLVEFLGTGEEAVRMKVEGAYRDSGLVYSVVSRNFGYAAQWGRGGALELVHKPTGYRLHSSTYGLEGDYFLVRNLTYSNYSRVIYYFDKHSSNWASVGLSQRALSHPEEFELILRGAEPQKSFTADIQVDFRLLSEAPVVPNLPPPVPQENSPATEVAFYREPFLNSTGPQESYRKAVAEGNEWTARLGAVVAASGEPHKVVELWLKIWPEVSDCPKGIYATRAWILTNVDRLHFNTGTRRYEIR